MANNVVLKFDLNAGDSEKTIGDMRKEIGALTKDLGNLTKGTDEYYAAVAKIGGLKDELGDVQKEINSVSFDRWKGFAEVSNGVASGFTAILGAQKLFIGSNEAVEESLLQVQSAMAIISGAKGFIDSLEHGKNLLTSLTVSSKASAAAMKQTAVATEGAATATKTFGTAWRAIGIGLIVSAISALVANWEKIYNWLKDIFPVLNNLDGLFDKFMQTLSGIGNVVKKLFQGDFDVAASYAEGVAKKALEQAVEANRQFAQIAMDAASKEVEILKARGIKTYQLERNILTERLKLYEAYSSDYNDVLQQIRLLDANHEKALADERQKALEKQKEDLRKRNEELAKAEAERLQLLIAANGQVLSIQQQQEMDALNEVIKFGEARTAIEATQYSDRFGRYEEFAPKLLEATQATANVTVEQEQQASQQIKAIKQAQLEEELQLEMMKASNVLSVTGDLLANLSTLMGENSEEAKAIQIALGTIDSIRGAISAFTGMVQTFPGPWGIAAGIVAGGVALAAGMANVMKMKNVSTKNKSASASSGVSFTAPSVPTTSVQTRLDDTSVNDISSSVSRSPQRAYVVESDITTTQERVRNYSDDSEL